MANILLVDGDLDAVAANASTIKALGHSVSAASTLADALDAVRRDPPDLVILEAILEGKLAGLDLARSLARDYPDLPLIMLTSADERLTSWQLQNQDRDGWIPVRRYLEKPVMSDVLAYEIEHLLPAKDQA